jgi:50S ribosomal protein L16 3-hydroxylase
MPLLGEMTFAGFLRDHWQKKPLLVRGAFPGFRDPITPDELAGLSCEDGVESRLVRFRSPRRTRGGDSSPRRTRGGDSSPRRTRGGDRAEERGSKAWEVTWGPQSEAAFARLPERSWTLLVQEVNRWVPDAALLLDRFDFLPSVRVDDVMVSYAAPGGSVGPHLDSYDVFLVQGRGERRWKYHTKPTKDVRLVPGLDLRILSRFRPEADEVLGPGDMLYLPPGFAHHGVAVSPCLTYSVGFRSPRAGEAWSSFARARAAEADGSWLLQDPPLQPADNPGSIPLSLVRRVRAMIRSMDTSDDAIDRWFASFATQLKPGHEMEPRTRPFDATAISLRLARGARVARSEEGRWAFLPRGRGALLLYVAGVEIAVPSAAAELARELCTARRHEGKTLRAMARTAPARALLVRLFGMGALSFVR